MADLVDEVSRIEDFRNMLKGLTSEFAAKSHNNGEIRSKIKMINAMDDYALESAIKESDPEVLHKDLHDALTSAEAMAVLKDSRILSSTRNRWIEDFVSNHPNRSDLFYKIIILKAVFANEEFFDSVSDMGDTQVATIFETTESNVRAMHAYKKGLEPTTKIR